MKRDKFRNYLLYVCHETIKWDTLDDEFLCDGTFNCYIDLRCFQPIKDSFKFGVGFTLALYI